MPAKKNPDELTGLECGLIKNNAIKRYHIEELEKKLQDRTQFTIDLIKDNPAKLKQFYIIGDFWIKGYKMTELKEYTNKKGKKSMKHYIGEHYIGPQPKSKEPTLVPWNIKIDEKTIKLFDFDDDGWPVANKERFEKFYQ